MADLTRMSDDALADELARRRRLIEGAKADTDHAEREYDRAEEAFFEVEDEINRRRGER